MTLRSTGLRSPEPSRECSNIFLTMESPLLPCWTTLSRLPFIIFVSSLVSSRVLLSSVAGVVQFVDKFHRQSREIIDITRQSAPLRRIGTFGLAVGAACTFSLGIAGQVLTFHTRARLSFAPPICRMPLGPSQASPKLIPEAGSAPGFDIA